MRIVLDTNVFIAIIGKTSRHRWIFDEILSQNFTLCVSQEIILEYVEILERKTTFEVAHNIHQFLTVYPSVEHVEIYYRWNLIPDDPDDNKFVDCAVAAGVYHGLQKEQLNPATIAAPLNPPKYPVAHASVFSKSGAGYGVWCSISSSRQADALRQFPHPDVAVADQVAVVL